MRSFLSSACLAAALLTACADPVDKAAKKRIFSPEDPPKAVASALEELPVDQLSADAHAARRVLEMGAAEATERMGPHQYNASVSFEWSGNGNASKLSEKRSLVAGAGGVGGDFDGKLQNSRDQGLEVLRVAGKVYAKDQYGKFRQRLRDRGMAERTREDVYGALRDFEAIFAHRLQLSPQGNVTYEGRPAIRFAVSLGEPVEGETPVLKMPAPTYARDGGMDATTRRRHAFAERRKFKSVQGEVLVDREKTVVLKSHLEGRLSVSPEKGNGEAQLHLVLDTALTALGQDPSLHPPKEFLPDEDKPAGIADALDRFNIPRGNHADGGNETDLPDEEP